MTFYFDYKVKSQRKRNKKCDTHDNINAVGSRGDQINSGSRNFKVYSIKSFFSLFK